MEQQTGDGTNVNLDFQIFFVVVVVHFSSHTHTHKQNRMMVDNQSILVTRSWNNNNNGEMNESYEKLNDEEYITCP